MPADQLAIISSLYYGCTTTYIRSLRPTFAPRDRIPNTKSGSKGSSKKNQSNFRPKDVPSTHLNLLASVQFHLYPYKSPLFVFLQSLMATGCSINFLKLNLLSECPPFLNSHYQFQIDLAVPSVIKYNLNFFAICSFEYSISPLFRFQPIHS